MVATGKMLRAILSHAPEKTDQISLGIEKAQLRLLA
jgi:hypothetical protein